MPGKKEGAWAELAHLHPREPTHTHLPQASLPRALVPPARRHEPELALARAPAHTPAAGRVADSGAAPAPELKAAPAAAPGAVPVCGAADASVSGPAPASAAVAARALGAANGPVAVAVPASAAALSALGRSAFVPVCAVLAPPGCPLVASVAESVALLGPGFAGPEAGIAASLGLPVAQAAALGSVSASVLSSGSVAAPEVPSL